MTIWKRLTTPTISVPDEEERQKVTLLTSLSAALLLVGLIIIPLWMLLDQDFAARFPIGGGVLMALMVAFGFSHTRYYRAGASVVVAMLMLIVGSVMVTTPGTVYEKMLVLNFLIVAILLSSLLLSIRATVIVVALCVVGTLVFLITQEAPFPLTYPFLVFLTIMSCLFVVDTSIRRRYSQQIRESTVRYRSLFQQSHDAVFVLSIDGRVLEANQRAADLTGYAPEEMINLPMSAWSAEVEGSEDMREKMLHGDHIPVYERLIRLKNGSVIPVEISVELVRDSDNRPCHIQSVVRDIRQRKQMEAALRESEERYRSMVSAMAEGVVLQDRSGAVQTYNLAAERILGLPETRMNLPIPNLLVRRAVREDGTPFPEEMQPVALTLATGEPQRDIIMGVPKPNDGLTWISINSQPITQPDDSQPYAVVSSFSDITERKEAEELLRQSEERFSKAFRKSPVPMIISTTDPHCPQVIDANAAYMELVGYNWMELEGKNLIEMGIVPPEAAGEADGSSDEKVRETTIRNRAGDQLHVMVSSEHFMISGQKCDIQLLLDITQRKKNEEQTFALAMERERIDLLTRFIQTASHEFRTPLSVINSCFYMMTTINDETRRQRYSEQAAEQIMLLSRLMDMMLSMTRLDSGLPFTYQSLVVNDLVHQTIDVLQPLVDDKNLALRYMPSIATPLIQADSRWLSEAVRHVLENAIRFTPNMGSIRVSTRVDGKYIAIEIQDNGVGISPEAQTHIFERFWRQDQAHTTPGFGLGLPIAQKIIEQHGGTIRVESAVGTGSTFTLRLPISGGLI